MSQQRIRAKACRVEVYVDGDREDDLMAFVTDFSAEPVHDKERTAFLGEPRESINLNVQGWDGSFTVQETTAAWFDLWDRIQQAERNGSDLPNVSIVVKKTYLPPNGRIVYALSGDMRLTLDSSSLSGHDLVTSEWSFSCQDADRVV